MRIRITPIVVILLVLAIPVTRGVGRPVDLELVLLADASRSIDEAEIRFQRQGYAAALTSRRIVGAIRSGRHGRVALTYVEWGDASSQDIVVSWREIANEEHAQSFAADLLAAPRRAQGPNAIGSALAFAHRLIQSNEFEGLRKVIDFSGDSIYSGAGPPISVARQAALQDDIVINALAILCRVCSGRPGRYDLEAEYGRRIIGGPGSFVITADGRDRFLEAVSNKLFREISHRERARTRRGG